MCIAFSRVIASLILASISPFLFAQEDGVPRRGRWITGLRLNQNDLSGDAITAGMLSFGGRPGVATVFVGCRGVKNGGTPVLELRVSVPPFPGSATMPEQEQAKITFGTLSRSGAMEAFSANPQFIFVVPINSAEIAMLSGGTSIPGGISIAFQAGIRNGVIAADLPARNSALDTVLSACGAGGSGSVQSGSVAVGSNSSRAGASAMPADGTASGSTKDRTHFEIEEIKLGMTLQQALGVARSFGPPKITHENGETSVSFKTRDISFEPLSFDKAGTLYRMEVFSTKKAVTVTGPYNPKKMMQSSETFKKAVEVFGSPNEPPEDDAAHWSNPDGSSAGYFLNGDALEILAKEQK